MQSLVTSFFVKTTRISRLCEAARYLPVFPQTPRFSSSTVHRPVSVAIVGSGPSGCYTAKYLQSAYEKRKQPSTSGDGALPLNQLSTIQIDILDSLPTPYGLVRFGVAPDHPEVKNVQNDFDILFNEKGVAFYGNVHVGNDVSIAELRELYDVVVLSYGCQSDRTMGLPGEELDGVLSAREFVAWYNGHPHYNHIGAKVARAVTYGGTGRVRGASVVVIGHGNVALDCARVLAKGRPGLDDTDVTTRALEVLGDGVRTISIVGRRGHVQGAFTIKELRELVRLEEEGHEASLVVRADELDMGATPSSLDELKSPQGRPKTRIDTLLREAATRDIKSNLPKSVHLRFLLNPVRFTPGHDNPTSLGTVVCERTALEGPPGSQRARGTGEYETLLADLALVSIGYKGTALCGTEQWFDDKSCTMRHDHGRIDEASQTLGGLYTAGWLKRGPSGIIGTNISDAKETVSTILADLVTTGWTSKGKADLVGLLRQRKIKYVDWNGYGRIVVKESARKRNETQPREKIVHLAELLQAASVPNTDT